MKIYEILNARDSLVKLLDKEFTNFKVVRELAGLRKAVEAEVEFYVGEEKKLIDKHAEKDPAGNPIFVDGGRVKIKSVEDRNEFEKKVNELRNLDVEIKKVTLSASDFKEGNAITPNEYLALETLIDFID